MLYMTASREELRLARYTLIFLLQSGFLRQYKKSSLTPTSSALEFLGI